MLVVDQLQKSDRQLRVVAQVVLAGMCILLAGLWYVQIIASSRYVAHEKGQSFRTVRIPAVRGKILDRHGTALAENRPSYNISLYLEDLRQQFTFQYTNLVRKEFLRAHPGVKISSRDKVGLYRTSRYLAASNVVQEIAQLMQIPLVLDEKQFHLHYERRPHLPLPVILNVNSTQIARFLEQPILPQGADIEIQPTRVYPFGTMGAHLLGYLTRDTSSVTNEKAFMTYQTYRGTVGLEGAFDDELRGSPGVKSVRVNRLGYRHSESLWTPAQPGNNMVLTIDATIQEAAEAALASGPAGTNTRGAVIVLDAAPGTAGDVLALASSPVYNPNWFVSRLTPEALVWLNDTNYTPQINRASQGVYTPGSIFKIVVALACLEAGVIDPNEVYLSRGFYPLGDGIRDTAPPGPYNFKRAFIKSSNTYFIEHGLRARLDSLLNMGHRFFLGQSCYPLDTLQDKRGYFPPTEVAQKQRQLRWTEGDTANLCIGQGKITVTPMQMASMTLAVATGGKVFWPRLVQRIEPYHSYPEEDELRHFPVRPRGDLGVDEKNMNLVREAMRADVGDPDGTGKAAEVPGMFVCGKTGTAEVMKGRRLDHYTTWFASFAPQHNPRYVVLVMVDYGSSGGGSCAPIAQKVYRALQKVDLKKASTLAAN